MKVRFSRILINSFNQTILFSDTTIPTPFIYHYETISSSPVRSSYENNTQQPVYVSFEPNTPSISKPITPVFQRKFPIVSVAILGFIEFLSGLIVLMLELIIFDIALGLWCGGIYALAGASIIVLGLLKRKFFL
jgi:hypothetical protein